MADPVAALIARSQETRLYPLTAVEQRNELFTLVNPDEEAIATGVTWEDAYYIRAAYDPALIPALVALQARVAALEAALAPLAALYIAPQCEGPYGNPIVLTVFPATGDRAAITADDVRRARALLGRE